MKHNFCVTIVFFIVIGLYSCNSDKKEKPDDSVQQLLPDVLTEVTAITLKTLDFEHELVSNGKISARTVAELKFQTSETIAHIFVKNGLQVAQGQRIAVLDTYSINNRLEQAKDALDRSRLEMQDVLIGQGYKLDSLDAVPDDVMQLARVKSGFNSAQTQFNMATYDLQRAALTAPIGGVIANLFAKPHAFVARRSFLQHYRHA